MITPQNHPIKFLLQFESVLLAIAILIELVPLPFGPHRTPLLNLVCLVIFMGLGLRLPDREASLKVVHLASSVALLVFATFVGKVRLVILLYVVLVVRSGFILPARSRTLMTLSVFVLAVVHQFYRLQFERLPPGIRSGIGPRIGQMAEFREERALVMTVSSLILLGLVLVIMQLMVDAILSERRSRQELEQANIQLRQYALRIEDVATLQERNRIAREIHDALGHSLTAFNLHLEAALRLFNRDPQEAKALLIEAKQLAANSLQDVRQSVAELRSNPLQGKSLSVAIQALIDDFSRSTGIQPEFVCDQALVDCLNLSSEQQVTIYRIVQEALTNISKHAQATIVKISLSQIDQQCQLIIDDNGCGFDRSLTSSGFGLQGIKERTQFLGGTSNIQTQLNQGCKIIITVPI
jgi:signal transduction histidine kinase